MRMRKKKHGAERFAACSAMIYDKSTNCFGNDHPVRLEIGCGKGRFILETAKRNPEINFIAVEKVTDVLLLAMEHAMAEGITNVRFLNCDATVLTDLIAPHSITLIYLNFSDPWPKKGYYKRRLTYRGFLEQYRQLLVPGGGIHQKTDNAILFDFSLEEYRACGFRCDAITRDLHHSEWETDNVHTEYEDNFSAKGFPIHRVEAYLSYAPENAPNNESA